MHKIGASESTIFTSAEWVCNIARQPLLIISQILSELNNLLKKGFHMNVEDIFIQAIRDKKKVKIRFQSKQDSVEKERICAPMDYGPSRRTHDRSNRYHLWDYDSASGPHTLLLLPEQLISVKTLDEYFDPKEFVKWDLAKSAWSISRDWGDYS